MSTSQSRRGHQRGESNYDAEGKRCLPSKNLPRLNTPCIGWTYSQGVGRSEIKVPLIIWWLEPQAPNYVKRKAYISDLAERSAPLRTNLAKTIRKDNSQYGGARFHVHPTNTSRYFYAVPKINDTEHPGDELVFAGKNLMDYDTYSYIPSFIATQQELEGDDLLAAGEASNELNDARGSADEQWLYRNIVISTCKDEGANVNEAKDPTCNTTASAIPMSEEFKLLPEQASALGWTLDSFLQYLYDNTRLNFQQFGLQHRMDRVTRPEFIAAQALLLGSIDNGDKGYSVFANTGQLVSPDGNIIAGLRVPNSPPPWVV